MPSSARTPSAPAPTPGGKRGGASARGAAGARSGASAAGGPQGPQRRRGLRGRVGGRAGGRAGRVTAQAKQLRDVYQMTRRVDPSTTWWLLGAFVVGVGLGVLVGVLTGHPIYFTVLGVIAGVLAALFILARRAERAAYAQLEGQPGAAGAALRSLRRGWTVDEEPVAVDPRTKDTVFRAVGRPGVVLVSDGPPHRVGKLLDGERRRVLRVLPDVPVHALQSGRGDGQVPLGRLPRKIMRLRPTLTRQEAGEITKRLRALGGMRPPIPKGIDPMRARPDRRTARGR